MVLNKFTRIFIFIIIFFVIATIKVYSIYNQYYCYNKTTIQEYETTDTEEEITFDTIMENMGQYVSEDDVKLLGTIIYNEARDLSKLEQSCVAWVVLNRCDLYNTSIETVVTAKNQFAYYPNKKYDSDILVDYEDLARDVIIRYLCEKAGFEDVGRTLPNDYYYFNGDGKANYFRKQFESTEYWDYSLPNPY